MTALEIIQQVSIKLGFDKPTTIEDQTDTHTQRLLGQLNTILFELVLDYDWQILTKQFKFTTNSGLKQEINGVFGYPIINLVYDFKCFITHSLYNMTTRCKIDEITTDIYEINQLYVSSPYSRYKFMYNMICFSPDLPDGQEISFFYRSKYPVLDSPDYLNTSQEYFSRDKQLSVFDPALLVLGTIWKYKDETGVDYAESYRSYEKYLDKLKDQDTARSTISGNGHIGRYPFLNIPDTGFG